MDEPQLNKFEIRDAILLQICYLVGDLVKSAKHGEVRKCMHFQSMKQRGIKVISKNMISSEQKSQMIDQIKISMELDHPNILKTYEVFQDDRHFYIVQELAEGQELFDYIVKRPLFYE